LNYFGVYRGAPLSNLSSARQPSVDGTISKEPQHIESTLTGQYKITPDFLVGAMGHFYYYPVGNPVGTGQDMQMLDPSIRVDRLNLVNNSGFKLHGRFTAQLPMTKVDFLQSEQLLTSLTASMITSYDVPNTSLTVGIFSYARAYVQEAGAPAGSRSYKLYVAPNANYQITKTVAATLWIDWIQALRRQGTGFFSGLQNDVMDIEPGINWDVSKYFSINPIINIYPSNPTLKSTSLQAFIVARAF
jgi:hypothetical protein